MEPGVDYWRFYQDRLNEKNPVTNTDLHRLCQWLRSKDVTNDVALKLSKLIEELRRRAVPFNVDIYNDLIHLHIKRRKFQDAQKIIEILAREPQDMPTSQRLLALQMAMHLRSGNETALQKLVEDKENGIKQYMDQFLAWTKGLQLTNDQIDHVKRIFHDIQSARCPPNSRRFTHLLETLFARNRPEEAIALVKHTLDIGFPADKFTSSCVMSGLLKARLYDQAIQVWDRIAQQSGARPDLVVFNSLLSVLCQEPKTFPTAVEIWNRVLADPEIKPDAYSFSSMLSGYFRVHDSDSALGLWEVMQIKPYSIRPTPILFNTVITGLFYNHLPEKAKEFYEGMIACNDEIPLDTYQIMIKGLLSVLDQEALNKVLSRMSKSGIEPSDMTYNIVADTIFSQRDAKSAIEVMELMSSRGIPKTAVTYSAAIAGFVKIGALDDAKKVFEEMKLAGCQPSIHTYGAMMQGAFKAGDVGLAEEMANLAMTTTKEGMSPGAYSIMITGYANLLMMDQAEKWAVDMQRTALKDNNARPPWKVYYTLLQVCVKNRLWDSANRVLEVMKISEFHSTVPKLTKLIQEVERVRDGGVQRAVSKTASARAPRPSTTLNLEIEN
ncbi:hypothetical protein BGZ58_006204 [Dissophora ornata]|nr:hypothetical protein BGZ58_006204 [Dissophora ornata]